jgi:hypothetical protein
MEKKGRWKRKEDGKEGKMEQKGLISFLNFLLFWY